MTDVVDSEPIRVTLEGWHPACWTLDATAGRDGGILGHGIAGGIDGGLGWYTVYGESNSIVDELLDAIDGADRTRMVQTVPRSPELGGRPGNCYRNALVAFDPGNGIRSALTNHGLLHVGPSRHEDGLEHRTLVGWTDRRSVIDRLDQVADENDVDYDLLTIGTAGTDGRAPFESADSLTERQREAVKVARDRGYYAYPRAVTATELASELGIAKTTFLEHLRKAEAKLIGPYDLE